jgi:hypothetical protein
MHCGVLAKSFFTDQADCKPDIPLKVRFRNPEWKGDE